MTMQEMQKKIDESKTIEEVEMWTRKLIQRKNKNLYKKLQNAVLREITGTSAAAARRDMGM